MLEWTVYDGFKIVPLLTVVGSLPNSLLQWPTPSSATVSKKRPHQRMNTLPELSQNHVNFFIIIIQGYLLSIFCVIIIILSVPCLPLN